MTFEDKNRLVDYLGKCLKILPNDEYIRNLCLHYTDELFSDTEMVYDNITIGALKGFITSIIDFDTRNYNFHQIRHFDFSHEFHDYFIECMPKDLRDKKLYLLKNTRHTKRNPLEAVANDIVNDSIRLFYNENKLSLHLKSI